jgi:LemA protein
MNKVLIIAVPIIIIVAAVGALVLSYNGLVTASVGVDQSWGDIQVQYQRRADLIPKVINATNLYINYEQKLLTDITNARSAWAKSIQGSTSDQVNATQALDSVTSRLQTVLIVENYPDLKGNQVVLTLIDELEGTENRIAVSRTRYNQAVADYNGKVLIFPTNIVAGSFGFHQRPYFRSQTGLNSP